RVEGLAPDLGGREFTGEFEHERVDTFVRDEQVRAEPDGRDRQVRLTRERDRLLELCDRLGPGEEPRRSPGADRRHAAERDVSLDLHASASRTSGPARSTSPAPIVRTRSPGRARPARKRAPSSTVGVQATFVQGRSSASASTTSFPLTPSTGCSRAAETSVTATAPA